MAYALISPNEFVYMADGNRGMRVCEIAQEEFPVAPPLFWTESKEGVDAAELFWDGEKLAPLPVVEEKAKTTAPDIEALQAKINELQALLNSLSR